MHPSDNAGKPRTDRISEMQESFDMVLQLVLPNDSTFVSKQLLKLLNDHQLGESGLWGIQNDVMRSQTTVWRIFWVGIEFSYAHYSLSRRDDRSLISRSAGTHIPL
jgi:hypothetical protein